MTVHNLGSLEVHGWMSGVLGIPSDYVLECVFLEKGSTALLPEPKLLELPGRKDGSVKQPKEIIKADGEGSKVTKSPQHQILEL